MKNTLLALVLVSVFAQVTSLPLAEAQVQTAAKVSRLAKLKKWIKEEGSDYKFVRSLTLAGIVGPPLFWVTHEMGMPHFVKMMCAIEAKTSGRKSFIPKEETCNLYYGDPRFNSCQVANDAVALMFPSDTPGVAVRFVGKFRDGRLANLSQSFVTANMKDKKNFELIGLPVEMNFDPSGNAVDLRPEPSVSIAKNQIESEDQAEAFRFYEEVGAVVRLAYTECSEGKYEKMLQDMMKRAAAAKKAAGTKK